MISFHGKENASLSTVHQLNKFTVKGQRLQCSGLGKGWPKRKEELQFLHALGFQQKHFCSHQHGVWIQAKQIMHKCMIVGTKLCRCFE